MSDTVLFCINNDFFCFFNLVELEAVIHTALSELTMRPLLGKDAEEHCKL